MNSLVPVQHHRTGSERPIVVGLLAVLAALCWAYLLLRAAGLPQPDHGAAGAMPEPPPAPYRASELLLVFGMWVAVASAMMLPGATPTVLAYARVARFYHTVRRPYLGTALFVLGYLLAWSGFAALAALGQWALHDAGALDRSMAVPHPAAAGLALVAAGVYQWTPAKQHALRDCRAPLPFVLTGWRRGPWGACRMGMTYGLACIGCCWLLTLLLFAAGVMNLAAIAGLAALVLAEKLLPGGPWLATLAGLALVAWGTLLLFP